MLQRNYVSNALCKQEGKEVDTRFHNSSSNATITKTRHSQWEGKCSRVNLTVIFESAIIAELDLGVYVCGGG